MPRRNYTPAERALHLIGAVAGKTLLEVDIAINKGDVMCAVPVDLRKELPKSSFETLPRYAKESGLTREQAQALWDHCVGPKTLGDL